MNDKLKLAVAGSCALAGFVLFYVLSGMPMALRVLVLIGCLIISIVPACFTLLGRDVAGFVLESYREVQKVVWPTRQETLQTAVAIFVFALVMTVYMWLIDKSLEWILYDVILGWRK